MFQHLIRIIFQFTLSICQELRGFFLSALTMNTERIKNVTGQMNIGKVAINYKKTPLLVQEIPDLHIYVAWESILGSAIAGLYHDILFSLHFTLPIIDQHQTPGRLGHSSDTVLSLCVLCF